MKTECHGLVSECLQCRRTDYCDRYPSKDEIRAMKCGHVNGAANIFKRKQIKKERKENE